MSDPNTVTMQTYEAHGLPAVVADERAHLIELCAWLASLKADHDSLEARLNGQILHAYGDSLGEMDRKAAEIEKTHAAIAELAGRHPEWFSAGETIQSRFGVLKRTSGKSLQIDDEEVTLDAIHGLTELDPASLLHTSIAPDKEALAKLTDAELAPLGVRRVVTTKYTFSPKPLVPVVEKPRKPRQGKAKAAPVAQPEPEVAHA